MMKLNFFLLLLLILPISQAIEINTQSDSFQVFTNNFVEGCRCSEVQDSIIIQNTGSYASNYILESELNTDSNQLFLDPGQQGEFAIYYPVSCENIEAIFDFKISSSYGLVKEFSKLFKTGMCQNLMVYGTSGEHACFDKQNTYNLTVENTGSFNEDYELFNDDYFINFSLNSSSSKNIIISLNNTGNKNTTFNIKSVKNELNAMILFPGFKPCYSHELIMEESYSFCQGLYSDINISLINNNLSSDNFTLETSFGELDNYSVFLEPSEVKNFKLSLFSNVELSEVLKFKVFSSSPTRTYSINISTMNCNIPELIVQDQKLCEEPVVVTVKNTGEEQADYSVNFLNNSEDISIESNSSEVLNFWIDDSEFSGKETVFVYLNEHSELSDEASFKIEYQNLYSCYEPKLSKEFFTIKPHHNNIKLSLKPLGFQASYYDMNLESDILSLESTNISLPASLIFGVDNNKPFGTYESNLTLKYGNLSYQFIIVTKYKDYNEFELIFIAFQDSKVAIPSLILFSLIFLLILATLIIRIGNIKKKCNKNAFIFIPLVLFVFFLGYVISTPLELQEPHSNKSSLYFEFFVNESLNLNLNNFISDADSDNISFYYNGSKDVFVNNSLVTINSYNLEQFNVVFLAVDDSGSIESPVFTFQPIMREEKTLTEWINVYSNYVYLVLAFFLLGSIYSFISALHKHSKKK